MAWYMVHGTWPVCLTQSRERDKNRFKPFQHEILTFRDFGLWVGCMKRANVVIPADASLLHAKLNTEPDRQMKEKA